MRIAIKYLGIKVGDVEVTKSAAQQLGIVLCKSTSSAIRDVRLCAISDSLRRQWAPDRFAIMPAQSIERVSTIALRMNDQKPSFRSACMQQRDLQAS